MINLKSYIKKDKLKEIAKNNVIRLTNFLNSDNIFLL